MKTVIELAEEAGFERLFEDTGDWVCFTDEIERLVELARVDERETLLQNSVQAHEVEAFRDVVPCAAIWARSNT